MDVVCWAWATCGWYRAESTIDRRSTTTAWRQEAVHAAQALQQVAEQANNEILAEQERVKASADPSRCVNFIGD